MSEEDDNAAGPSEGAFLDNSRRSRRQRLEDFLSAAGLQMNDMLDCVRKQPILEDVVTDEHRELVIDLKAAGCSDEGVARFLKITRQMCERLFEWELANGRQLRTAQVVRSLNVNAIHLGDTSAQIGYLKNQPQEEWGTKHSQKVIEDAPPAEDEQRRLADNEQFIAGIVAGLNIDTTKFKPAAPRPKVAPVAAESKKIGYNGGTVRKPKGD